MKKLLSKPLVFLIRLYQIFLSPILPNSCRFLPTCSHYAVEALEKHGPFLGLYLSVWRILRCNPWNKGGYDPVPDKVFKRKQKNQSNDTLQK
ncbi:MAG: membrane protein insertion efficiency factor YidD [Bacteroidales bacterium]|nr:membrane protein insertion efficiency factor YidD [Bacteroidales bacterium]